MNPRRLLAIYPFVGIAVLFVSGPLEAQTGPQMTARDAIDALDSFVAGIRSYDVVLKVERRYTAAFKRTSSDVKGGGYWEKLPPDQPPKTVVTFSRQVLSSDGRRRFERMAGAGAPAYDLAVFTGQSTRLFSPKSNTGSIRPRGPDKKPFTTKDESYAALFGEMPAGGALVNLFRRRSEANVAVSSGDSPAEVVLSAAQEPGSKSFPAFSVRVVLDRLHGFAPKRINVFVRGERMVRYDIDEFLEVEPGVWAPVRATVYEGPDDLTYAVTALTVDVARSSWNKPLADELFVLKFPSGAGIVDETRGVSLIAGSNDPGTHIDNLIADARVVMSGNEHSLAAQKTSSWRTVLVVANGMLIAVIFGWWAVRYFGQPRRSTIP